MPVIEDFDGRPVRSRDSGVALSLVCEVWGRSGCLLHTAPVRHPSPKIRARTVCVEGVRGAACAAVSSMRKLSSGGYRCHDRFPSDSW